MNYEEKRMLYENIMGDLKKVFQKRVSDFIGSSGQPFTLIDSFVKKVVDAVNQRIMTDVPQKELADLFAANYRKRQQSISRVTHHPGLKEDFTVDSFNTSFVNIQKKLKILMGVSEWQITVVDNFDTGQNDVNIVTVYDSSVAVDIVVANVNHNIDVMNDFMTRNGYFLIRKVRTEVPFNDSTGTLYHLLYTPSVRKDISSDIRKTERLLFHMTDRENLTSIKAVGLVPKERTGEINDIIYPARVYMFTEDAVKEDWFEAYSVQLSSEHKDSGKYILIEIDLNKVPENIAMFYDPLIGRSAVYVETTINPDWFGEITNI